MFELVEEALDLMLAQVPCAGDGLAQAVAVVGTVGQQDLAASHVSQHVGGAGTVMPVPR